MTLATTFHSIAQRSRDFLSDEAQVTAAIKTILRAVLDHNYGTSIERICRGLAIVIAFSYAAGYALGAWLHQCNQQLAAFARQFHEPDWHEQRLAALKARLVVRETGSGDPQPCLVCTDAPQATAVTPVLVPLAPVAPKTRARRKAAATKAPSATDRKRRAKNAECTTPQGFAAG
jgi:hypothetical protein